MPVAQAAPARQPESRNRKALRGTRGERLLPWCRPASTATISRRRRFAMVEVAGPLPVLAKTAPLPIRKSATRSLTILPQSKTARCDLLHKGPRRIALNLENGPENLPNAAVRAPSRDRHRLGLDRHRGRSIPDRADLPHSDLISAETTARNPPRPRDGYLRAPKRFSPRRQFSKGFRLRGGTASPRNPSSGNAPHG